ncbi:DUF5763 domain-containing protein [Pedobacter boryungensis]|uniref:DUF5763 domain-containing protein n=1 Tax=Pedobacter boryungensis TaxID=869962 RepID=UPI0037427C3C
MFSAPPSKTSTLHFSGTVATCYGNSPCKACSNCSGCKYCNNGGTCGICAKAKTTKPNTLTSDKSSANKTSVYVGQCKALTKKGARCKRSANSNGYCWQHGK